MDFCSIIERPDGYYVEQKRKINKITNFIIRPLRAFYKPPEPGSSAPPMSHLEVEILQKDKLIVRLMLHNDVWYSRGKFIRAISGYSNFAFVGCGFDLQRIKYHIFENKIYEEVQLNK